MPRPRGRDRAAKRPDRDERPAGAVPAGWAEVVEASEAKRAEEDAAEPARGDVLQHPTLGTLEVLHVDDRRIEVRDRSRKHRKLARACLEFFAGRGGAGRRVLRVVVRSDS